MPAGNAVAGAALDAEANTAGLPTIAIRASVVVPNACATMGAAMPTTSSEAPTILRLRWKCVLRNLLAPVDDVACEEAGSSSASPATWMGSTPHRIVLEVELGVGSAG